METLRPLVAPVKDFLSILDLNHQDLERLIAVAVHMKADRRKGGPAPTSTRGRC